MAPGWQVEVDGRPGVLLEADLILRVRPAAPDEAELQKSGSMASGLMDPFGSPELMASFAKAGAGEDDSEDGAGDGVSAS